MTGHAHMYDLINRPGSGMVLFPIALRENLSVHVHMPTDMTTAEAEKVARVILAHVNEGLKP